MHDDSRGSWARRHGRDIMLLVLTWAAGNIDAVGYLALGQVFTVVVAGLVLEKEASHDVAFANPNCYTS